jgi:hypothetical protein
MSLLLIQANVAIAHFEPAEADEMDVDPVKVRTTREGEDDRREVP